MKTYMSDIAPCELHNNIFFVGAKKVSVHIVKTEEGLVMIDTGYPDMYDQITDSMEYLGLDVKDIIAIFHSHGHIDHFGCTSQFKEVSGAKTYISRIDNDIINGTYDLSWAKELKLDRLPPFNCDVLIEDGDVFSFGTTTIRCRLAPGHTDGTLAFFIETEDNGEKIVAAMHGGMGGNSMTKEFLDAYGLPYDCRDKFKEGLVKLREEKVDLVLGNHPGQSDTVGKIERLQKGEKSVLDKTEWARRLIEKEKEHDEFIKNGF